MLIEQEELQCAIEALGKERKKERLRGMELLEQHKHLIGGALAAAYLVADHFYNMPMVYAGSIMGFLGVYLVSIDRSTAWR